MKKHHNIHNLSRPNFSAENNYLSICRYFYFELLLFRLRRESAQVDRELEESQRETARLREVLRLREVEVQRLRERVAAQRARRDAANQAKSNKNQNQ